MQLSESDVEQLHEKISLRKVTKFKTKYKNVLHEMSKNIMSKLIDRKLLLNSPTTES